MRWCRSTLGADRLDAMTQLVDCPYTVNRKNSGQDAQHQFLGWELRHLMTCSKA